MVDLPSVGNAIVTSTAPVSSVSRGDIQQNADMMANSLAKVADATMDIATREAKTQAANDLQNQKITRDPDGNVTVTNPIQSPLLFGNAAVAYEDATRAGTVAQHGNVISQELNELHQKFPADPKKFAAAASSWRDSYLQQHGGGQTGELLAQTFDQTATQHFNAITDVAGKADLAKASTDISTSQQNALDDASAMARGGTPTNDPAIQAKFEQWDRGAASRLANPLFSYSQAQYESDAKGFHDQVAGSAFIHDINKTYSDPGDGGGYKGAMAKAETILIDPNYGLSQQQREAFYHRATAEIHTNEALRRQDIAEVRAGFSDLTMQSAAGQPVSSDQVEALGKAADAAGDPGLKARIFAAFVRKPLNDSFGQQSIPQMNQQIGAMDGVHALAAANKFFIERGYSPEAAAGIVGHLPIESGMNTTAVGDGGTSGGLAQWHAERLTALKAYAASVGKPATDFQTQLQFIDKELHSTESATLAKLQAAKTPEQAATAFMSYERPAGYTPENPAGGLGYQSRVTMARAVYDGKAPDMSLGPAGSAWLVQNRKNTLDDAATKQWQTVMKDYNSTENSVLPSVKTVSDVVDAARITGNSALLEQIAHDTQRMDLARTAGQQPLADQDTAIANMRAAGASGNLSPGDAAQLKDLQRRRDAIVTGTDKDPVATTVANFSSAIKEPAPLDMSSDAALAQGLQQRGKIVAFAADRWKTPALSALDSGEIKQVQAVLANPDPAVKLRVFQAISTLPPDIRGATLKKLGEGGPLSATEVFAGSLVNEAPQVAAGILVGLQATDANKRLVPGGEGSPQGAGTAYQTAKDAAFPISAFNLSARTNPTGSYATMSKAIDARYAALAAQAGDTSGSVNSKRLQQAAQDVTGGVLYHNGAPIIAPARNMPQRQFDGIMAGITDADVAGMTTSGNKPITADYLRNSAKLQALSTGRYLVQVNQDDGNPKYAQGRDGKAFVLDLRNRPSVPITAAAMPEAVYQ